MRSAVPGSADRLSVGEAGLAAGVGVDLGAVDEYPYRPAEHVKGITRPDDQIGVLAWFDGPEPVIDARDPSRVDRERSQRVLPVQAVFHREGGLVDKEVDRHNWMIG